MQEVVLAQIEAKHFPGVCLAKPLNVSAQHFFFLLTVQSSHMVCALNVWEGSFFQCRSCVCRRALIRI